MRSGISVALALLLAIGIAGGTASATGPDAADRAGGTTNVPMRVLQEFDDPANIYVSNRSGRDWVAHVAVPLAIDDGVIDPWRYGDITVELPVSAVPDSRITVNVDVRVWQHVDDPWRLYVSARGEGGSWATMGTVPLPLDDGFTPLRKYRYDDLTVEVPFAGPASVGPPVSSPATLVWLGEIPADRRAQVRGHLDQVMTFYADRYGLAPMPFTLFVAPDSDTGVATLRDLNGANWALGASGYTGTTEEHGLFIIYDDFNYADAAASPTTLLDPGVRGVLVHEYFHVLQRHLSGDRAYLAPHWLEEGTADYAHSLYLPAGIADRGFSYWRGGRTTAQRMQGAAFAGLPLSSLETGSAFWDLKRPGTHPGYDLGLLAVRWLAEHAGEDSYIDFWRELQDSETWQDAFRAAFGMTTTSFYAAFEEYRRAVLPMPRRIQGTVVGPAGEPLEGVRVGIWESNPVPGSNISVTGYDSRTTGEDGLFDLQFLDGNFKIVLHVWPRGGVHKQLGWYTGDGIGTCPEARTVVLSGADVTGIEIRLPAAPADLPDIRPVEKRGLECVR